MSRKFTLHIIVEKPITWEPALNQV